MSGMSSKIKETLSVKDNNILHVADTPTRTEATYTSADKKLATKEIAPESIVSPTHSAPSINTYVNRHSSATEPAPEISILCPAYNVEKYLSECLDSVINQTFTDWELILVDDGAKDGTPAICDRYGALDSRIRVVHQQNMGLSGARNTALSMARGKYIAMIDSDDYADPRWLEVMHEMLTRTGADVAQVGYWRTFTHTARPRPLFKEARVLDAKEAYAELVRDSALPSYVWNKLYRREIITSPFPQGKNFEDIYALTDWFANVKSVAVSPEKLIYYRIRRGSILNSNYAKNRIDYLTARDYRVQRMRQLYPDMYSEEEQQIFLNKSYVGAAVPVARLENDPKVRREYVKRLSDELKKQPICTPAQLGAKTWLRARMLRKYPRIFTQMIRTAYKLNFRMRSRAKLMFD